MKSLKNLYYDVKVMRKWERVNRNLYMHEIDDFMRAVNMAQAQARVNAKACKAYDKALKKAARAMGL